jgi:hypothetical protein
MINNCPKCGKPYDTGGVCHQCPQLTATDGAWLFIQFEDPEIFRLQSALSRTKSNLELCEKSLRAYAEKVDQLQTECAGHRNATESLLVSYRSLTHSYKYALEQRDEARKWAVALYKAAKFWGALWNHTSGGDDER